MAFSDVTAVTNHFATANEGFSTTTSGPVTSGTTTVGLNSTSGLTNGSIFVGVIEPGGSKEQVFTGVVDTGGSQLTGVKWTRGTNVDHSTGVSVVDYDTGTGFNMMRKGILVQHNQDGTHANTITTNTINENTVANGVTIDSLNIKDGALTNLYNPYKFSAYQTGDTSVTDSVYTKISLNTEDFDSNNNFDSTTNFRYTAPVSGFYFLSGQVGITTAGSSPSVIMLAAMYKNGAGLFYSSQTPGSGSASSIPRASLNRLVQLSAGDYIELFAYIGESGRLIQGGSTITFLTGFLVSKT